MKILRMTNQDKAFYSIMGPFLARREIEKEIGYPIYDDDGKVWFIALKGKEVIGFCYIAEKKKQHYQLGSYYVIKGNRHKGVFRILFNNAIDGVNGTIALTTKNDYVKEFLAEEGFTVTQARGGFTEYSKEYGANETVRESGLQCAGSAN